jgi:hypothetical protein
MKTSQLLYAEVPYPLRMGEFIDASREGGNEALDGLFYRPEYRPASILSPLTTTIGVLTALPAVGSTQQGLILNLRDTYGFIQPMPAGTIYLSPSGHWRLVRCSGCKSACACPMNTAAESEGQLHRGFGYFPTKCCRPKFSYRALSQVHRTHNAHDGLSLRFR